MKRKTFFCIFSLMYKLKVRTLKVHFKMGSSNNSTPRILPFHIQSSFLFSGPTKLGPHKIHQFSVDSSAKSEIISHVRVVIQPDGGISRFRLLGSMA